MMKKIFILTLIATIFSVAALAQDTLITPPENLSTDTYRFTATALINGEAETSNYDEQVTIGFDGNDVYILGLVRECPDEFWCKATKNNEGNYVIPACQHIGTRTVWFYEFPYYMTAKNDKEGFEDIILTLDENTMTFTTPQTVVLNGQPSSWEPYITFTNVNISLINEKAATPVTPQVSLFKNEGDYPYVSFNIPNNGTNGEKLLSSKLYYTIWIEKDGQEQPLTLKKEQYVRLTEDLTEIPYIFTDNHDIFVHGEQVYLEQGADEINSWTKIGIQSIYYGANECKKSAIDWKQLKEPTSIANPTAPKKSAEIYTLGGQRTETMKKGLYITNGKKVIK